MRIGILTFWKTEDNYGQLLQCYATQTYLRSLGHETFLVKATTGRDYNPGLREQLFSKLRTAYRLLPYPLYLTQRAVKSAFYTLTHGRLKPYITQREFEEFRQKYLNCTDREYTLDMLKNDPPQADAYVVGSDQIWNTTDGIYFLSWAKDNVLKVSMAASFGARHATPQFCDLISTWLRRFDLITVREQSGLEICREAGYDSPHLAPDPTLLLRSADYDRLRSPQPQRHRYLFIYFLGTRTDIDWKQINAYAKREGLDIVYVGSQGQEDKYPKEEPAIGQWLSLIANAEYMITNSFHGTLFAIQYRKNFVVYPISGIASGMNSRLTTLLTPLGLTDRIYSDNLDILKDHVDFDRVFDILDKQTDQCKALLSDVFKNIS